MTQKNKVILGLIGLACLLILGLIRLTAPTTEERDRKNAIGAEVIRNYSIDKAKWLTQNKSKNKGSKDPRAKGEPIFTQSYKHVFYLDLGNDNFARVAVDDSLQDNFARKLVDTLTLRCSKAKADCSFFPDPGLNACGDDAKLPGDAPGVRLVELKRPFKLVCQPRATCEQRTGAYDFHWRSEPLPGDLVLGQLDALLTRQSGCEKGAKTAAATKAQNIYLFSL